MLPRAPKNFPHPCFVPFRDDPGLTAEENIIAYWKIHDAYFALVHEYRARHPSQDDARIVRVDDPPETKDKVPAYRNNWPG